MKKVKTSIVIGLCLLSVIPACVKNSASTGYTGSTNSSKLVLSKSVVERGEPLLASTTKPDANAIIRWSVYPENKTVILPTNNQAAIFINNPGSHQVKANYYLPSDTTIAYDSSNSTITVIDSTYTPPPIGSDFDTASLAGDQLTLIPTSSMDSGLVILVKTNRLYNCYPYLTAYGGMRGSGISSLGFDFSSAEVVEGKGDCAGIKNPAYAYMPLNELATGIYTINAYLNDTSYQGSLTVTDTDYTFTWNYSSGIIISPLHVKRN